MDSHFISRLQKRPQVLAALVAIIILLLMVMIGYGLMTGTPGILPHLIYIPIIITAYFFPRRAVFFASFVSLVYTVILLTRQNLQPGEIPYLMGQIAMFILIAAVVSLLTTRLVESERLFRGVAERSSDIIMLTDLAGRATYVSPSFGKILNMGPAEIKGKAPDDFIHPEDVGIAHAACEDLTNGKTSVNITVRTRRKDGEYVPIEYLGSPVIADGLIAGFQIVGRDVTERWRVDEAQREISRKLAEIIDFLPDPTMVVDTAGIVVAWNHAMEELSGIPALSVIGKGDYAYSDWITGGRHPIMIDYVLQQDYERIKKVYPHVRFRGNIVQSEALITLASGTRISLWISATPLIDQNGEITGAIESLRDVTHQKTIEQELRELNTYLDSVINSLADPLFIKDRSHRYVKLNDRFCRFTRHTREELLGKTDFDIFRQNEAEIFRKQDDEVFTTGQEKENEANYTDSHGNTYTIITKATRYVNADGDEFIVGIMRDITERKKTELALQQALKKLGMLSSITRHDILNQIMGLRTYLELIMERETDPDILRYLRKGDIAADAIRSQIEFTRIYENLGVTTPRWYDVAAMFRSALSQFPLTGIAVDVRVSGLYAYADPLIEKVFYNLIENTLRHGGTVTSIMLSSEETQNGVVVTYRDNGVGIAAEDKPKLFCKGFGKHTGLGLFLSREILSITGITITENGEPGKGVRFEIMIPAGGSRIITGDT
ncbi:MAG: PAS domain S-box protein [Methanoregula sp.]|jgi:PAS domain S-box-containing protein|nr:PAS domain S-box protein [Methanoregula sp.]